MKKLWLLLILFLNINVTGENKSFIEDSYKDFFKFVENKRRVEKNVEEVLLKIERQKRYDTIYFYVKKYIKKAEGYRSKPYYCLGGERTIGFGHVISSSDSLNYPINKNVADSLLDKDLNAAINYVEKVTELDKYKNPFKVLALSSLVYNIGSGNFQNSSLLRKIKTGGNVSEEFIKWIYINNSKGVNENNHLKNRRFKERSMYYADNLKEVKDFL